jgi:aspartyl-tRNA(Asn)/glutamyl-tRNA(Gln) amidotransferase subunit B
MSDPAAQDPRPEASAGSRWESVIGLEVHAQLRTRSKLFSSAPNAFGAEPNTQTTEVDLGMPGVLPVLNAAAIELALRAGIALGCAIRPVSRFARKHYFYPDLPKGYQISQYEEPYAQGGAVPIELDGELREIPLTRIHMEEDAGKSIHDDAITGTDASHVDLNRAGVPLIEIVSEPALRSAAEAGAYLRSLRAILRYLQVSDGDMEKGQLRCDANVSVRRRGDTKLGTKVELKNLNSFRFLEHAIEYEIGRQISVLEQGGALVQETRHWDERAGVSRPSRSKEQAADYRYFPDPDLVPLQVSEERVAELTKQLPELPHRRRERYRSALGLADGTAQMLADEREIAELFEATLALYPQPIALANWIARSVLEIVRETGRGLSELHVEAASFAALLELVDAKRVTSANARKILAEMARSGRAPAEIMKTEGLETLADTGELDALARSVVAANPAQQEQFRAGETKVLNFLLGQVMKQSRGKADPSAAREALLRALES